MFVFAIIIAVVVVVVVFVVACNVTESVKSKERGRDPTLFLSLRLRTFLTEKVHFRSTSIVNCLCVHS